MVDDNEDAADLLAELRRMAGHVVAVAYDGPQALRLLTTFPIDVGVLDIGLPVMDGNDLAREIRALPVGRTCALIALTGYGQAAVASRSAAAGFDATLSKPVSSDVLLSEIARRTSSAG
ncbi:MAG: response regulator [Minicystis sp.]